MDTQLKAAFDEYGKKGWDFSLVSQPSNSPDTNTLDLGYFAAILYLQQKTIAHSNGFQCLGQLFDAAGLLKLGCDTRSNSADDIPVNLAFAALSPKTPIVSTKHACNDMNVWFSLSYRDWMAAKKPKSKTLVSGEFDGCGASDIDRLRDLYLAMASFSSESYGGT
ncbi:hypothetical protein H310_05618 [Aphanomyces invadans]|uniref:Uncharacterized protein n=1 Tax=Aphanomyces invadans TaxID=157072 RepID=A0A024UAG7_9STRA|nr:hypothetical protein H310_05618 [Aphanomyces invadans]ETW03215.1 hypothetical protein H310_05618 [Aphanomyces invadans]|eukprot:XP_008868599.1 hypothetical protein H310_05618 [Aphanomyces invadans]